MAAPCFASIPPPAQSSLASVRPLSASRRRLGLHHRWTYSSAELPAWNVTSAAFGGPHFDQLYVTSAGEHLDDLKPLGNDGAVFLLTNVGAHGLPQRPFTLSRSKK